MDQELSILRSRETESSILKKAAVQQSIDAKLSFIAKGAVWEITKKWGIEVILSVACFVFMLRAFNVISLSASIALCQWVSLIFLHRIVCGFSSHHAYTLSLTPCSDEDFMRHCMRCHKAKLWKIFVVHLLFCCGLALWMSHSNPALDTFTIAALISLGALMNLGIVHLIWNINYVSPFLLGHTLLLIVLYFLIHKLAFAPDALDKILWIVPSRWLMILVYDTNSSIDQEKAWICIGIMAIIVVMLMLLILQLLTQEYSQTHLSELLIENEMDDDVPDEDESTLTLALPVDPTVGFWDRWTERFLNPKQKVLQEMEPPRNMNSKVKWYAIWIASTSVVNVSFFVFGWQLPLDYHKIIIFFNIIAVVLQVMLYAGRHSLLDRKNISSSSSLPMLLLFPVSFWEIATIPWRKNITMLPLIFCGNLCLSYTYSLAFEEGCQFGMPLLLGSVLRAFAVTSLMNGCVLIYHFFFLLDANVRRNSFDRILLIAAALLIIAVVLQFGFIFSFPAEIMRIDDVFIGIAAWFLLAPHGLVVLLMLFCRYRLFGKKSRPIQIIE